ncbi:MAG: peptidoglycan editing factor PgeF [Nitrospirae bacterium]|nr:peptidoglycan editing factor PgeF [Nitrospirota bacterium]MCL5421804.1 peptidoglycan editing factor PgeF [Nitrospirota bacterium]
METLIFPKIFGSRVKAFFTGKTPGADLQRISKIATINIKNVYLPIQKHTDKVLLLDSFEPRIGDAVITDKKGVLIGVQGADCVPILLYDRRTHATGAVHAGWRGTAAEILKKTIEAMGDRFSSSPSDIVVAVGPAIRWCCYGVGYDVIEAVVKATGAGEYFKMKGEQYCLDLPTANRHQAVSTGILPEHIWMSDDCTFCFPEKFYSYRFVKGPTGRQGGFIGIVG